MASAWITTRKTPSGARRHVVRYRLGGFAYPILHAGSFKLMKEARARRDLIGGEIAAGRNPSRVLAAMLEQTRTAVVTVSQHRDAYLASRFSADPNTVKNKRTALKKFCATFGDRDPETLTPSDIIGWVRSLVDEGKKPSTINLYVLEARLLLDFAKVDPNPVRDPSVQLPKQVRDEPHPVPLEHYLAALGSLGRKWLLAILTIEQGGLRESEGVQLRWGDVDASSSRLRLPRSATKRDRNRWVTLPGWLMEAIEATCPLEDRTPDRRVFQGITAQSLYQAWVRACRNAKVPHYTVHDLRDRRGTIWHHEDKLVARELAERLGHSDPWMSLNVYAGAMPVKEASESTLRALLEP